MTDPKLFVRVEMVLRYAVGYFEFYIDSLTATYDLIIALDIFIIK